MLLRWTVSITSTFSGSVLSECNVVLPFFRPPFVSVTLTGYHNTIGIQIPLTNLGIWSLFPDVQTPLRTLAGFVSIYYHSKRSYSFL